MSRQLTPKAATLLARFLDDPRRDDELAVLADALTEAGDPRGELISLQLAPSSPSTEKRIKKLVAASRAELLGPLAEILDDVTFRRGFLARADVASTATAGAIAKTLGDPLWATVEHLAGPKDATIAVHPMMRSLRSLARSGLSTRVLGTLRWLESLAIRYFDDSSEFERANAFPALRHLAVTFGYAHTHDTGLARIRRSRIRPRLASLTIETLIGTNDFGTHGLDPGDLDVVEDWMTLVPSLEIPAVTLVTIQGKKSTTYRRIGDRLEVAIPRFPKSDADELNASVERMIAASGAMTVHRS